MRVRSPPLRGVGKRRSTVVYLQSPCRLQRAEEMCAWSTNRRVSYTGCGISRTRSSPNMKCKAGSRQCETIRDMRQWLIAKHHFVEQALLMTCLTNRKPTLRSSTQLFWIWREYNRPSSKTSIFSSRPFPAVHGDERPQSATGSAAPVDRASLRGPVGSLAREDPCDFFTCSLVSSVTVPALHLRTLPQGP